MSRKKNEENDNTAQQRILKAASEIFAEKGFDGARVDELTAKAGVNKELIYYYFESKEIILDELLRRAINDSISQKKLLWNQISTIDRDYIAEMADLNYKQLKDQHEFIKIAVTEALKSN